MCCTLASMQGTQHCVCKIRPGKSCSFWYAAVFGITSRSAPARGRAPRCPCGQPPASAARRAPPAAPAQCSAPVCPANKKKHALDIIPRKLVLCTNVKRGIWSKATSDGQLWSRTPFQGYFRSKGPGAPPLYRFAGMASYYPKVHWRSGWYVKFESWMHQGIHFYGGGTLPPLWPSKSTQDMAT